MMQQYVISPISVKGSEAGGETMEDEMIEAELCVLAPDLHLVLWMRMYIGFH